MIFDKFRTSNAYKKKKREWFLVKSVQYVVLIIRFGSYSLSNPHNEILNVLFNTDYWKTWIIKIFHSGQKMVSILLNFRSGTRQFDIDICLLCQVLHQKGIFSENTLRTFRSRFSYQLICQKINLRYVNFFLRCEVH